MSDNCLVASPQELMRIENLMALLPKGQATVLEIGARQGMITRRLVEHFESVTALDLERPSFQIERVIPVKGDVQRLEFTDNSFDCVLCTEVLEHLPEAGKAAREIARVARHSVLIGVPYRQDTRVGRMTCIHCGKINPPYGHLNRFDEAVLRRLFSGLTVASVQCIGSNRERTNALAAWLMDQSGNRYGDYAQEEPCMYCSRKMSPPSSLSVMRRLYASMGAKLYALQCLFNRPRPTWIHMLFQKER